MVPNIQIDFDLGPKLPGNKDLIKSNFRREFVEFLEKPHHCNMRFILTISIILLLFVVKPGFAQDPYLARLSTSGTIGELGISSKGDIWVATASGQVYYRSKADQLWRENNISAKDDNVSNHFERINFFSDSTIVLSGFLQENRKEDFIFRSEDYGKSWTKVRFGESSWIDGAHFSKDGKAWMTGNSQYIYYTKNSGKTWQTFDKIEKTGNLRLISIYFKKDGKTGLFGSTWNSLYLTTDNCESWTKIPTPLTQKKYTRISKTNHPAIRKIRILGNHYIIRQEGRTFISKIDLIEWQYLPEIVDFEVTDSGNLYAIQKDWSVHLYNSDFSSIWTSDQKMSLPTTAIAVQGEKLIALTHEQLYQISPGNFESSELLSSNSSIPKPELQLQVGGENYGFSGKDILKYDTIRSQWFRYMQLNFYTKNATIINGKLLISDQRNNKFYELNLPKKIIVPAQLPSKMIDIKTNPVVEFHLEYGSHGCFHQSNSIQSFVRNGKRFIFNREASHGSFSTNLTETIDAKTIDTLVGTIAGFKLDKLSIEDLDINQQDIERFKKYIDQQAKQIKKKGLDEYRIDETVYTFPGENTDFNYYKQVADSLYTLSPEVINAVFSQPDSYWSTTTNTRRIILVFKDGKKLIIENSYNQPNYLYMPWNIEYGELKLKSNSIQFGKAIDHLTKGSFFVQDVRDKNYAIFRIADYLYRQKISQ